MNKIDIDNLIKDMERIRKRSPNLFEALAKEDKSIITKGSEV